VDLIVKAYLADIYIVTQDLTQPIRLLAHIWDARQLVIRGQAADAGLGPHGLMATGTAP
jgi:hypothetical protein